VEHEVRAVDGIVRGRDGERHELPHRLQRQRLPRRRPRRERRHHLVPRLLEHAPRRRELAARPERVGPDVAADGEDLGAEVVERRLPGRERVRLERERADEDARAAAPAARRHGAMK
jgi:hypothetical protein